MDMDKHFYINGKHYTAEKVEAMEAQIAELVEMLDEIVTIANHTYEEEIALYTKGRKLVAKHKGE